MKKLEKLGGWGKAREVALEHLWHVFGMSAMLMLITIAAVIVSIWVVDPMERNGLLAMCGTFWVIVSWGSRAGLTTKIQHLLQELANEHLGEVHKLKEEFGRMCWDQIRDVASQRLSLVAQEIDSRIVEKGLVYGADTAKGLESKERVLGVQGFFRESDNSGAMILLEFVSEEDE